MHDRRTTVTEKKILSFAVGKIMIESTKEKYTVTLSHDSDFNNDY